MSNDNKGYRLKRPLLGSLGYLGHTLPRFEDVQVMCRRCRHTWLENRMVYPAMSGQSTVYDCCSKCRTPTDDVEGLG